MPASPPDLSHPITSLTHHTLDLDALYSRNHHRYRDYADLLLTPTDTHLALRATRDYLADEWAHAISTNPAAFAWDALRRRVHLLAGPGPLRPVAHLAAPEQDVLLLHLVLGMPEAEVAALTGADPAVVHVRLRTLARRPG
ncbi:hypothetical protein ACIRRH_35535 [Kitasatospora sp. NPDC101235]|uniref:hypothetical protein n=1 Tax=Kitasatospora sp. NPDC101235 TaxID=3364101 RepID=UPI003829C745